ncbi:hypothetical protein BJX70DRAFT_390603 [Aspergillus crustosus]
MATTYQPMNLTPVQLTSMPHLAEDAAARRRAQTRLNTRAYRKRKALTAAAAAATTTTTTPNKPEELIECWDNTQQSISLIPASHVRTLYNAKTPLLPSKPKDRQRQTKTALLPTTLQQTTLHPDWIDKFPSPGARDHLIQLVNAGAIDDDDLWKDCIGGLFEGFPDDEISRRGIVAWSPPWDIKGWEMSEGFVRKWGWVFAGVEGVMQTTNWWRAGRGEELLVFEV